MYYLISILLGLIPETLYITLFICYTKNIKEKKIFLFILIGIAYFICLLIQQYILFFYLLFIILIYFILKLLYKNKVQIIDIFIISISHIWIALISSVCFIFCKDDFSNYYLLYIINRILLFLPLFFKNKLFLLSNKYYKLWNRNKNANNPIKSITLRNISLILLNSFIIFLDITICNINNILNK